MLALVGVRFSCGCDGGGGVGSDFGVAGTADFLGARDFGLAFGVLVLLPLLLPIIGLAVGILIAANGDVDAEFEPDEPADPLPMPASTGACD